MKKIFFVLCLITSIGYAQEEKVLFVAKDSLNKLMREEIQPFISKTIIGKMTIESIDETKRQAIKDKYDSIYVKLENDIKNKPPSNKELYGTALLKELGTPEDQLEMIYNDMLNGTTVWKDKRTEIKNRFK